MSILSDETTAEIPAPRISNDDAPPTPQWQTLAEIEQAAADFITELCQYAPDHARAAKLVDGTHICLRCGEVWPCPPARDSIARWGRGLREAK